MLTDVEPRVSSPGLGGRPGQVSALDAALAEAGRGHPSAVLVGGEAGVGKSRLVREFAGRSRDTGARVLIGGCPTAAHTLRPYCLHFTTARYYGPDKWLQIISGRSRPC